MSDATNSEQVRGQPGYRRLFEPPVCLLCGSQVRATECGQSPAEIERAWGELGVTFGEEAFGALRALERIAVFQCHRCSFRFSDPRLAGNASFYAELGQQQASYYPPLAPEFLRTVRFAVRRNLGEVLDIGCGGGAFLDLAKDAGLRTFGLELSGLAAETCRAKGHAVANVALSDFRGHGGRAAYQLVTAFQVLEHVPDPVQFVRQAASLVEPGGYLAVAVPNELGVHQLCPWDPHLWPPHHISRWRAEDLKHLGRRCGLRIVQSGSDRLHGAEIEHFWKLHNRLARVLDKKPLLGGQWLPRLLSLLYRKTGSKYVFPSRGTSIYAFYERDQNHAL